jgi:hypothetical protein
VGSSALSADVSFAAPSSDGGATIDRYRATATDQTTGETFTATGTASPITVSGLRSASTYGFTVAAENSAGWGSSSLVAPDTTIAYVVPSTPALTSVTRGDARATVVFTGSTAVDFPVIDYTVVATDLDEPSRGGQYATGTLGSLVVTGLTNGDRYTFAVRANNAIGQSEASAPSAAVLIGTAPGAPRGIAGAPPVATPGSGSASVAFVAPLSDGGAAISGYTVTATDLTEPAAGGQIATGASSPIVVSSLTNGHSYTFAVTATNAIGTGTGSDASAAVTVGYPGAPTITSTWSRDAAADFNLAASAFDGGSPITNYTVTLSPGGAFCSTGASLSCAVTGLTNGVVYAATATATNGLGTGLASAPVIVRPYGSPTTPVFTSVVPGNHQITLSWAAPTSDGGSAITGYYAYGIAGGIPGSVSCSTSGERTCTITGLTNGASYRFFVYAYNDDGYSSPDPVNDIESFSDPVIPGVAATVPGAPTITSVEPGNGQVTVSWSAPSSTGGSPITGYTVTAAPGGRTCAAASASCVVEGLSNGTPYTFSVTATNSVGTGASSASSESVTPATPSTVPGAPSITSVAAGDSQVAVSWSAPASNGGSAITKYTVTSSTGGRTCESASTLCGGGPVERQAVHILGDGHERGRYGCIVRRVGLGDAGDGPGCDMDRVGRGRGGSGHGVVVDDGLGRRIADHGVHGDGLAGWAHLHIRVIVVCGYCSRRHNGLHIQCDCYKRGGHGFAIRRIRRGNPVGASSDRAGCTDDDIGRVW